jgi:undecaprenyl diphosphate synthase
MTEAHNSSVQHLGIIMDGNRRWAKANGIPSLIGHKKGGETLKKVGSWCIDHGIKFLTVWAFSTENWNRPKDEISYLMKLLIHFAKQEVQELKRLGVKLQVIGRIKEFPEDVQEALRHAIDETKQNTRVTLNLALNYGGRAEIVDAIKKILKSKIDPESFSEKVMSDYLYVPTLPAPDLVIRTGGVVRTSGFLLWETPYTEWYFSKMRWPEFSEKELDMALLDFAGRQRNFGK